MFKKTTSIDESKHQLMETNRQRKENIEKDQAPTLYGVDLGNLKKEHDHGQK